MAVTIKECDLYEHINEYDAILIGTGTYCSMSQGLQRKVMLNYPYVQDENMKTKYGDKKKLGTVLECKENGKPTFILMYAYEGNFRPDKNKEYVSYESVEKCFKIINILYKDKKLASTIIGASKFDGNGDKNKLLKIIENNSSNINITIYDYEQKSRSEELKEQYEKEKKLKETDLEAYYEAVKKRKEEAKIRRLKNGHAAY